MEYRNVKGTVFDVQHMSIHDGPGIRTSVFLKGCPLHCLWCQNPESQDTKPQLMFRKERCTGCGRCIPSCPSSAITLSDSSKSVTDFSKCSQCMNCITICHAGARIVSGEIKLVKDVVDEVAKDKLFYGKDGGMTVTGGEPMAQPEFSRALFAEAHLRGIHTCIETCSYTSWEIEKRVMEYVDLAIMDVKHLDSRRHKELTGVGNEQILKNVSGVSQILKKPAIIRMPIIPGYNDEEKNIHELGRFVSECVPTCLEVGLLPYHRMGEGKREGIGKDIEDFTAEPPSNHRMEELRDIIRSFGLTCK